MPKLPYVDLERGELHTDAGSPLVLDSPAWDAWLVEALLFYVEHETGRFSVTKSKAKRGKPYWVARRKTQGHVEQVYLGQRPTRESLLHAAGTLGRREAERPTVVPGRRVLTNQQLAQVANGMSPESIAAALQSLLDSDIDPAQRAALHRVQALVAAAWPETVVEGPGMGEQHAPR